MNRDCAMYEGTVTGRIYGTGHRYVVTKPGGEAIRVNNEISVFVGRMSLRVFFSHVGNTQYICLCLQVVIGDLYDMMAVEIHADMWIDTVELSRDEVRSMTITNFAVRNRSIIITTVPNQTVRENDNIIEANMTNKIIFLTI